MTLFAFVTLGTVIAAMLAGAVALARYTPQRSRKPARRRRSRRRLPIAVAALLGLAGCIGVAARAGTDALAFVGLVSGCALYGGVIAWVVTRGSKSRRADDDDDAGSGGAGPGDGPSPIEPLGGLNIDWERFESDAFRAYQAHCGRELAGSR
jgi:hypothetical protein